MYECNLFFPIKHGYKYEDERYGTHPDRNKSFFFWKDYDNIIPYEDRNSEYMHSRHYLFEIDGESNYWDGNVPKYDDYLDGIKVGNQFDHYGFNGGKVPIDILGPDDETSTDYARRYMFYTMNRCIWGLIDCNCGSIGTPCHKDDTQFLKTHGYAAWEDPGCMCGEYDSEDSMDGEIISLGIHEPSRLANRMERLGYD